MAKPIGKGPGPADDTEGPKHINVIVTADDHTRLRLLSITGRKSLQKMLHEALNMLLASKGLPPLEPQPANTKGSPKGG